MGAALLFLAGSRIALAADCPQTADWAGIAAKLDAADSAFAELEVDAFTVATDEARLMLPCIGEALSPAAAARFHRSVGVLLVVGRDPQRGARALAAARALEPAFEFPASLLPAGHPVRELYGAPLPSSPAFETVLAPVAGRIAFDGAEGPGRPADRATIAQVFDAGGAVTATRYLFPADPLPPYEAVPAPVSEPASLAEARPPRDPILRRRMLMGSGAAALVGGLLYWGAVSTEARFQDTGTDLGRPELDDLRGENRLLFWSSVGAGGVAVAAGVGAAFVAEW